MLMRQRGPIHLPAGFKSQLGLGSERERGGCALAGPGSTATHSRAPARRPHDTCLLGACPRRAALLFLTVQHDSSTWRGVARRSAPLHPRPAPGPRPRPQPARRHPRAAPSRPRSRGWRSGRPCLLLAARGALRCCAVVRRRHEEDEDADGRRRKREDREDREEREERPAGVQLLQRTSTPP